jgi:hypothetical protein
MFFRPPSDPGPELLRPAPLGASLQASRAGYSLPLSGFRLDIVAGPDEVLRLEVRDRLRLEPAEPSESPEPLHATRVLAVFAGVPTTTQKLRLRAQARA